MPSVKKSLFRTLLLIIAMSFTVCGVALCQILAPKTSQAQVILPVSPNARKAMALVKMLPCTSFDPKSASVELVDGSWKVMGGNTPLLDYGAYQLRARAALSIIQFYKMNTQYLLGKPEEGLQFYLIDGEPPVGAAPGETGRPFDPRTLSVSNSSGLWWLKAGDYSMVDFYDDEADARTSVNILKSYDFHFICSVEGRPGNAPMVYFRQAATTPGVSAKAQMSAVVTPRPKPATTPDTSGSSGDTKVEVTKPDRNAKPEGVYDFTVAFQGTITVTAPCEVIYSFVGNDGDASVLSSLKFDAAGSKSVEDTLKFNGSRSGWEMIKIIWPTAAQSNQASYQAQL